MLIEDLVQLWDEFTTWLDLRASDLDIALFWISAVVLILALLLPIVRGRRRLRHRRGTKVDIASIPGSRPATNTKRAVVEDLLDRLLTRDLTYRRVEKMTFVDPQRVRRRVSVDVAVRDEIACVPVGLSRKDPSPTVQVGVRGFSAFDACGCSVSLLGRYQNSELTFQAASLAATRSITIATEKVLAAPAGAQSLTDQELDAIWRIVAHQADEATAQLREILSLRPHVREALGMVDASDSVGRKAVSWSELLSRIGGSRDLMRIAVAFEFDPKFYLLLRRLAASWVIILNRWWTPGTSRVIAKYEHDDLIGTGRALSVGRIWSGLGFRPTNLSIPRMTSIPAQSLHVELEAPPGVLIEEAQLEAIPSVAETGQQRDLGWIRRIVDRALVRIASAVEWARSLIGSLQRGAREVPKAVDAEAGYHSTLSHVYLPNIGILHRPEATVSLRAIAGPEWFGAALSALVLYGLLHSDPAMFAPTAQAIFLAIPGSFASVLLARQHLIVRPLLGTARLALWLLALASIVAAVIVLFDFASPAAEKRAFSLMQWPTGFALVVLLAFAMNSRARRLPLSKVHDRLSWHEPDGG